MKKRKMRNREVWRGRKAVLRAKAVRMVLFGCAAGMTMAEIRQTTPVNPFDLELLQKHGLARWERRPKPRWDGDRRGFEMVWFAVKSD